MGRNMLIHQFTDPNLIAVFSNCLDDMDKVYRKASKFARKHKMNDIEWVVNKNYGIKNGCI